MKKSFYVVLAIVIIIGILYSNSFLIDKKIKEIDFANNQIQSVSFVCAKNKTIQAIFFNEKVELTLSDKRTMLLMQAISASGARFTSTDESFVFWNKGNSAFIEEKGKQTFENCEIK